MDGLEKCPLNFFELFGHLELIYIYIYTCIQNKSCRQQSYGFQNLMQSWGSGSNFSNLQQVGDFSILGSKSVTFYFSSGFFNGVSILMSSWGSGLKFSNLQQMGEFSILGSKSVIFYKGF